VGFVGPAGNPNPSKDLAFTNPDPADNQSSIPVPSFGRALSVHSRTQFRPSIEHPFPNPDPAGNPPLSLFPCFVLADRSPFSPVNLGSIGSTGRAVCWIFDSLWVQRAGDWRGERVWNGDCRGEGHFCILTFIPCRTPHQFVKLLFVKDCKYP
jgi:hypothetical protein